MSYPIENPSNCIDHKWSDPDGTCRLCGTEYPSSFGSVDIDDEAVYDSLPWKHPVKLGTKKPLHSDGRSISGRSVGRNKRYAKRVTEKHLVGRKVTMRRTVIFEGVEFGPGDEPPKAMLSGKGLKNAIVRAHLSFDPPITIGEVGGEGDPLIAAGRKSSGTAQQTKSQEPQNPPSSNQEGSPTTSTTPDSGLSQGNPRSLSDDLIERLTVLNDEDKNGTIRDALEEAGVTPARSATKKDLLAARDELIS